MFKNNPRGRGDPFSNFYFVVIILLLGTFTSSSSSLKISLYENTKKQGEDITLKDLQNCTNLPSEWQDRASSINIYETVCVKVFEHSGCKGKYINLKSSIHGESEYLDNLRDLGFNDVISSVSPCALPIENGRYVIQNLGDNKMMTLVNEGIYSKVYSKYWLNLANQQFDINPVAGSAVLYEVNPVGGQSHFDHPVVFDNTDLPKLGSYKLEKPAFIIESVDDWKYVIKDSRTKLCLTTIGKKDEINPAPCLVQVKAHQWIFRRVQ